MGPLCKSLLFVFHPPVQSPLFQTETMPKLSSIIKSPSSYKLADFDVKCNSPAFFFFHIRKWITLCLAVQTLHHTVCMISEERKYRAFSSHRNVPLELLFGRKYNGTSKLDIPVLRMWLQKKLGESCGSTFNFELIDSTSQPSRFRMRKQRAVCCQTNGWYYKPKTQCYYHTL